MISKRHITSLLSAGFGRWASHPFPPSIQRTINRLYVRWMGLDMHAFAPAESYPTLTALFTRALKIERYWDQRDDVIIAPCDGRISDAGYVHEGMAHQIKGMRYDTAALLGAPHAHNLARLEAGPYLNLYLSPRDYHRYHAPIDLRIHSVTHIPGKLYPVNLPSLRRTPNLFIENERVVIESTDTNGHTHYLVLVGALNVGKIVLTFEPRLQTNTPSRERTHYRYDEPRLLKKGELFGWFELGSTLVILSEKGAACYDVTIGQSVAFGQTIGYQRGDQNART